MPNVKAVGCSPTFLIGMLILDPTAVPIVALKMHLLYLGFGWHVHVELVVVPTVSLL